MERKAVILLSGGVDSSTAAAIAKSRGFSLYALSFLYGQRHSRELDSAKAVAKKLGAKRHLVIEFDLGEIGGSALTGAFKVPKGKRPTGGAGRIPITYVPARNTIFLSFALSWAEVLGAPDIFIGANITDYSGYPDCRPEYMRAFERMANLATKISVEGRLKFKINTPLIKMNKAGIIKKGAALGLDYGLTWSCYDPLPGGGGKEQKPCLRCDSCLYRARGFKEAGMEDPLLKKIFRRPKTATGIPLPEYPAR